ncbi:MAG: MFS transporter [Erythrobacter sp.]|uniref:MFS transporter n=1 Tax=Erythrobacter sp. TaxID=1042 RepID=UPI003267066A
MTGVATGASPIPFNTLPIVIGPINYAMGWSFQEISIGIAIYGTLGAILAPAVGALADRVGTKPVAMASLLGFGLAFGLMAFVPDNLMAFYGIWALIGIVGIGSTPVSWSRTINLWFYENRGLALGILLLGTSLAGFVVPQIANAVLEASNWRNVFLALAALPIFVGLPLAYFLFRDPLPEERPLQVASSSGELSGKTLRETLTGHRFWILFISIMCIALAYGGAHIHMVQMVQMHGLAPTTAASVMSVVALGIFSGRIIVGLLFDRFWAPAIAVPVLLLPIVACYLLIGTSTPAPVIFVAGYLLGFAAGAESDMIAYLSSRYFGMKSYGRIYGFLYMPFGIFSSLSATMYGAVRDQTGNYDLVLVWAMALFFVGGMILLLLGRYPVWTPKTEGAAQ